MARPAREPEQDDRPSVRTRRGDSPRGPGPGAEGLGHRQAGKAGQPRLQEPPPRRRAHLDQVPPRRLPDSLAPVPRPCAASFGRPVMAGPSRWFVVSRKTPPDYRKWSESSNNSFANDRVRALRCPGTGDGLYSGLCSAVSLGLMSTIPGGDPAMHVRRCLGMLVALLVIAGLPHARASKRRRRRRARPRSLPSLARRSAAGSTPRRSSTASSTIRLVQRHGH